MMSCRPRAATVETAASVELCQPVMQEKSIESSYRKLAGLLVERQRFAEAEEVLGLLKEKEASLD